MSIFDPIPDPMGIPGTDCLGLNKEMELPLLDQAAWGLDMDLQIAPIFIAAIQ